MTRQRARFNERTLVRGHAMSQSTDVDDFLASSTFESLSPRLFRPRSLTTRGIDERAAVPVNEETIDEEHTLVGDSWLKIEELFDTC